MRTGPRPRAARHTADHGARPRIAPSARGIRRRASLLPILLLGVGLLPAMATGCSRSMRAPGGVAGAPVAPAAVEQFLRYAGERDYRAMAWLFGTRTGPIIERDPLPEVEQRMYALASVLENDSFVVGSGTPVPGRIGEALAFQVTLTRGRQTYHVPFVAVRGPGDRWFVEQLDVESITAR